MSQAKLPRLGAPLNDREIQVLIGLSYGKTYGQIGTALFLSENTAKTHGRRLFAKLGVGDKAHAVRVGFELELLEPIRRAPEPPPPPPAPRPYSETHLAACYAAQACPCRKAVAA